LSYLLSNIRPIPLESDKMPNAARILLVVAVAAFYGCAQPPSRQMPQPSPPPPPKPAAKSSPTPRTAEPAPPNVNLSGFPLPYRQGYADGCASVSGGERKDASRFTSDANYRTGWQDGFTLCKKR
jgi:hypothetical protein